MKRLVCRALACAVLFGALTPGGRAETAPLRPPAGWRVVLHTSSLAQTRKLASWSKGFLSNFSVNLLAFVDRLLNRYDRKAVGDGPVAIGLLHGKQGEPVPFLLLTPPSFDRLVNEIDAEKVGDSAVLDAFGLTLLPFGRHTIAVFNSDADRVGQLRPDKSPLPPAGDLCLSVAQAQFAELAKNSSQATSAKRLSARRMRRLPWQWPPNLTQIEAVFGLNAPLWRRIEQKYSAGHLSINRGDKNTLTTRLVLERAQTPPAIPPSEAPEAFETGGILGIRADAAGLYLPDLIGLLTVYQQGRPDQIRARQYEPRAFDQYAEKLRATTALIDGFDARLLLPGEEAPAETNRLAVFDTADPSALTKALVDVVEAWNGVVEGSKAADRVIFKRRPFEQDGLRGVELRCDMIAAAGPGVKDTPEMRALMHRFVGNNGWWTIRLAELPNGRVLATDMPLASAVRAIREKQPLSKQPPEKQSRAGGVAAGRWRLDRHAAWRARLDGMQNQTTLGWQKKKPMAAAPPIEIGLRADSRQIELELSAPEATLVTLGDYLNAN